MELALSTGLVLLAVFPILLVLGIPISVTIGISSVLSILTELPWDNTVFAATEGAAIAVVYSLLLAMLFYKSIKMKDLPRILL